ncbi:hypothetical protein A5773_20055 [Mycobacterium sp. 852014-52450_SCH5900713]|uniref:hypothetical protein n=1 Tax=Mycobacterium sp. 852014-52450_SCH5900713 TaxID=1834116 RepID=UPI0007FFBAB0|nr:hypothetical protein [Mycobacterium sp. 852014-52450_SCH5900713]OBF93043.1 hypothetical protein A5773_20055 [Mycobacterium sp. 852014-52450_SCH5900713]
MTTTKARRRPLAFADLTAREQIGLRTAIHEAGHAVAATVLGGRIHAAVLTDGRVSGIHGKTVHAEVAAGSWPSVVYAGPWAEARWLDGKRPSQRLLFAILEGSGHLDNKALCAAAAADVSGDTSNEARLTVPPLLEMTWPAVVSVAQVLHRQGEARHDDVCKALGISDGGGPGSAQLAHIRAGLRPVPPIDARPPVPA